MALGRALTLAPTVLVAVAAGAVAEGDRPFHDLAAAAGQPAPLVRIGLSPAHRISVASAGGYRILDPRTGQALWKPRFTEEIQVVAQGGPRQGAGSIFRIQVGAFADEAAAERERRRLEQLLGAPGVVHHDPDRGNWRVRLGQAADRLELGPLMERLRQAGLSELWIAEEPAIQVSGVRLRLHDESYDSFVTDAPRLAVVPEGREPIRVGQTAYRGVVELRISPSGTVQPVNWIGLEPYLQGVVPAELGPNVWPQPEALAAQAVAARTYAWRNRTQFEDEGFDLCATPRCQVYGGVDVEHPMSDRAVWTTSGEILTWQERPIVALYTATCGGHTEAGGEIFAEHAEPYLRGVPCRAEEAALATQGGRLSGRAIEPLADETGTDVTRDWALLAAADVVEAEPAPARRAIDGALLQRWTAGLARLAGRPEPAGPARPVAGLGQAAAELIDLLGWTERAEVLLAAEDLPAVLRDGSALDLALPERRALAYLALIEGIRPFPDGSFHPERPPTGARLVPALARIGDTYQAFALRQAVVSGLGQQSIRMFEGKGQIRLPVAGDAFLFGLAAGQPVPAARLALWPGDRVRFRTGADGHADFLELLPPVQGASDDRSSRVYSWEVRKSRSELEAAINQRVSVGRLKDLRVVRRGVSGRVVELEVVGSEASTVVRGFDVRRLLDLRESLLVIEVQRDRGGAIEAVVFAGKGWGHGVGLCQVGAYGMALRGASYREILSHYYPGTALVKLAR